MNFILQWIDVLWLPVALVVVHKEQRGWALGFFLSCMLMLRLQAELLTFIGYPRGILFFMDSPVYQRGLIIYSLFYALYLIMAYYSPHTKGPVFMAASISIFFMALFTTMICMIL